MEIIDEKGNLFGTVNVIDALVVLLLISVVVAGVGLVFGSDEGPGQESPGPAGENAVRYATVDLGTQPNAVAEHVSAGDRVITNGSSNATVTDVYVGPGQNGQVSVTVRVELGGTLRAVGDSEQVFEYHGSRLTIGDQIALPTTEYSVSGTVTSLDAETETLQTRETQVVVSTNVSSETASAIDQGDTYELAGTNVGVIETVETYPTDEDGMHRAVVGLTLQTRSVHNQTHFGEHSVSLDDRIALDLDEYDLAGTVRHRGNTTLPGERTRTTAVIAVENVSPAVANATAVGLTERADGDVRAQVVDRREEASTVIVTSEDGEVYQREHPEQRDVYLTVELSTRRTETETYFHGRSLRQSDTISIDLHQVRVTGSVVEIRDNATSDG
jgi:hypothetical protein